MIDNIIGAAVGLATGYLSKKIVVGTSGNIIRRFFGLLMQLGVTNTVAQHPDSIKSIGQFIYQHFLRNKKRQNLNIVINKELQLPFYAKASIFFIGLVAFVAILYIAQGIIVPLVFSIIVAILLHPTVNFYGADENKQDYSHCNSINPYLPGACRSFRILIFSQARQFSESWPQHW